MLATSGDLLSCHVVANDLKIKQPVWRAREEVPHVIRRDKSHASACARASMRGLSRTSGIEPASFDCFAICVFSISSVSSVDLQRSVFTL